MGSVFETSENKRWEASRWQRRGLLRIRNGLLGVLFVLILGMTGYVLLGWRPSDAIYMVVITLSTVGFGEVQPVESSLERAHTILVIALGTLAVGYTLSALISFITEGEIQHFLGHQRVRKQIDELKDHVIVVGYGRMGRLLCAELRSAGVPFLLVDRGGELASEFDALGILHLTGDATEEEVLNAAGLSRAKAIVTTIPSDAENVFITLTAREMAPHVQIVARAEQPSTQKKLIQAGANQVVLPAAIGASRIASLLTNPSAVEFTELVTKRSRLAIQLEEVAVLASGELIGKSLRDADIGRRTGVMVIAIKRAAGAVEFPPVGNAPLMEGDSIVLLGGRENLDQFRAAFGADAKPPQDA